METFEIDIDTSRRRIVDISEDLKRFCRGNADGLVNVFVPHATAGLALMETGSGSEADLKVALDRLLHVMIDISMLTALRVTELTTSSPRSSARQ